MVSPRAGLLLGNQTAALKLTFAPREAKAYQFILPLKVRILRALFKLPLVFLCEHVFAWNVPDGDTKLLARVTKARSSSLLALVVVLMCNPLHDPYLSRDKSRCDSQTAAVF